MPVIVRELDDDAATVSMVDTNIQREDILPSEKARAYKMKYEAMKHQGSKGGRHTADEVGEEAGELTEGGVYAILVKKSVGNVKVTISPKRIRNYFPDGYTKTEIEEVIYSLLEEWKQKKKRGGEEGAGTPV